MLPSDAMAMSVTDFELLMAHFMLEQKESKLGSDRATAVQRARTNVGKIRR